MKHPTPGGFRVRSGARSGQNCYRQADQSWFCPEINAESLNCMFWNPYELSWNCYVSNSNEVRSGSSDVNGIMAMLDQYVADLESQGIGARCEHESYLDQQPIQFLGTEAPFATCYTEGTVGITCRTNPDDSWYCKNRGGYKYLTGAGGETALKQYLEERYSPETIRWK